VNGAAVRQIESIAKERNDEIRRQSKRERSYDLDDQNPSTLASNPR
jgi:hypothetical protein